MDINGDGLSDFVIVDESLKPDIYVSNFIYSKEAKNFFKQSTLIPEVIGNSTFLPMKR